MKSTAIAIAYYNKHKLLTNDFIKLCAILKSHYEIIITYNGTISNLAQLDPTIKCFKYGEKGYDLNCYMKGLEYILSSKKGFEKVIFINNSIKILDCFKFKILLEEISQKLDSFDFVGLTKNYEIKPHYQSFLFALSLKLNGDIILKLKKKVKDNPLINRSDVIQLFEIETINLLNKYKLKHTHLFNPKGLVRVKGFFNYLLKLGFLDNLAPLKSLNPGIVNPSIFMKREISSLYGFKKIKSTSIINKIKL